MKKIAFKPSCLLKERKVFNMNELIFNIEGMMCNGCENRVQNALQTIEGVKKVVANHVDGTVTVTLNNDIDESIIKEKLEDLGYEVKE